MRDIRPFLHLYLGCEIDTNIGRDFQMGSYKYRTLTTDNLDHILKTLSLEVLDSSVFYCKPYLRQLSSMTEEEMKELLTVGWPTLIEFSPVIKIHTRETQKHIKHGHGIGYSTFKENGEHFSTGTLAFSTFSPEQFVYLLSKGFDLFNLIPDLAIDSSTKTKVI